MAQTALKKLPIGVQNFEELRTENYLYIDKTEHIYKLAIGGKAYFLSRPRRFGKSMLCSTFRSLFEGKKHLFEGTFIDASDWEWKQYPVIYLSFTSIPHATPTELIENIKKKLLETACNYKITLEDGPLGGMLESLIKKLSTSDYKAVLLIDEYDKPLIKNLNNHELLAEYRNILKALYDPIKDCGELMRFLFITGVSQFSKLSIFSELNHLDNLSSSPKGSLLCGYTQAELEHNFSDYIENSTHEAGSSKDDLLLQIKRWYNGYCFTIPKDAPERVYNPFSIINFFNTKQFKNYWFESGTPTFAIDYFKQHTFSLADFENVEATEGQLNNILPEYLDLTTILYQTGYLTIKAYDSESQIYTIGFPNQEISKSCVESLVRFVFKQSDTTLRKLGTALRKMFEQNSLDQLQTTFSAICAQIPSTIAPQNERGYQFMFWMVLQYSNLNVSVEEPTALGRIDAVVTTDNCIYIIELKIRGTADQALEQIKDRRYAEKYTALGKPVTSIGAIFDINLRTMVECKIV